MRDSDVDDSGQRNPPDTPRPLSAAKIPRIPSLHRDALPAQREIRYGGFRRLRLLHSGIAPPPHLHERPGTDRRPARHPRTGFGSTRRADNLPWAADGGLRPFPAGESRSRLALGAAARNAPRLELQGGATSQDLDEKDPLKFWQKDILKLLGVRNPLFSWSLAGLVRAPDYSRCRIQRIQKYFHPAHAEFLWRSFRTNRCQAASSGYHARSSRSCRMHRADGRKPLSRPRLDYHLPRNTINF